MQFSLHPASSLFGTQHQLTHPPVKSSTLPLKKMPIFKGVATWPTNFTLSRVISPQDSATVHSPFGKELIPSFLEESCFSGLIALLCSHINLPGLTLVWFSPILIINFICAFILYVVYFYSERPPLSAIFYFMFGTFLQRKTATIQNILFYVWSISISKDRHFAEECSQNFGGVSQIRMQFFQTKHQKVIL